MYFAYVVYVCYVFMIYIINLSIAVVCALYCHLDHFILMMFYVIIFIMTFRDIKVFFCIKISCIKYLINLLHWNIVIHLYIAFFIYPCIINFFFHLALRPLYFSWKTIGSLDSNHTWLLIKKIKYLFWITCILILNIAFNFEF